jgi:hypothetical protein
LAASLARLSRQAHKREPISAPSAPKAKAAARGGDDHAVDDAFRAFEAVAARDVNAFKQHFFITFVGADVSRGARGTAHTALLRLAHFRGFGSSVAIFQKFSV